MAPKWNGSIVVVAWSSDESSVESRRPRFQLIPLSLARHTQGSVFNSKGINHFSSLKTAWRIHSMRRRHIDNAKTLLLEVMVSCMQVYRGGLKYQTVYVLRKTPGLCFLLLCFPLGLRVQDPFGWGCRHFDLRPQLMKLRSPDQNGNR